MEPIVDCEDLMKIYPGQNRPALEQVRLKLYPGETLTVRGPNGSGKTTLLRILAGLLNKSSGTLRLFGEEKRIQSREIRKRVGFCPSNEHSFFLNATARANLEFFGRLQGVSSRILKERIQTLSQEFSCAPLLDTVFQELSTGYKKRFALIRTLLHEPELVLLDEPFSPLDAEFRVTLSRYLEAYLKTRKAAAIICTHDVATTPSASLELKGAPQSVL